MPSCVRRITSLSSGATDKIVILGRRFSGGSGTLVYQGKRYPLNIGGVSLGATFGASKAELSGTVLNMTKPSDISGTYGATEAGYALVSGRKTARLKNAKGVVLVLRGRQVGLEVQLDLSGLQIALK